MTKVHTPHAGHNHYRIPSNLPPTLLSLYEPLTTAMPTWGRCCRLRWCRGLWLGSEASDRWRPRAYEQTDRPSVNQPTCHWTLVHPIHSHTTMLDRERGGCGGSLHLHLRLVHDGSRCLLLVQQCCGEGSTFPSLFLSSQSRNLFFV